MSEEKAQKPRHERREEKRKEDKMNKQGIPPEVQEFIKLVEDNHPKAVRIFEELKDLLADLGYTISSYLETTAAGIYPKSGMVPMSWNQWQKFQEFRKEKMNEAAGKEIGTPPEGTSNAPEPTEEQKQEQSEKGEAEQEQNAEA